MNMNAILAILERKGIITREEGEKVAEYLNNHVQSTQLAVVAEDIKDLIDKELPKVLANAVKSEAKTAAKDAVDSAEKEAKTAEVDAAKEADKVETEVKDKVEDKKA